MSPPASPPGSLGPDVSGEGIAKVVVRGGVSLGGAAAVQRVLGFVATTLAARIGGPSVFGAYAMGLATAGMVAGYAGLGVGTVASRYAGQFPRDTPAYRKILRFVGVAAGTSAAGAALALLAGGAPLAGLLLGNEALAPLLRAAAASAAALVLMEALNGLATGRLSFSSLFWLSGVSGAGLLVALTLGASYGPTAMLLGQAAAVGVATAVTLAASCDSLGVLPLRDDRGPEPPRNAEVLRFGATQLTATVGVGFAAWWVAVLVTRFDPSLREMGYYGVGNQLRGLVGLAPGLVSQLVLPLLVRFTDAREEQDRVLAASAFLSAVSSMVGGGLLLAGLPLVLDLYGPAYQHSAVVVALLVATAAAHLGGAPVATALLLIDLRATTLINLGWAASLVGLATWLVPPYGALGAAVAWLLSHVASQLLILAALRRHGRLVVGAARFWGLATAAVAVVAGLAGARSLYPHLAPGIAGVQLALLAAALVACARAGRAAGGAPHDVPAGFAGSRSVLPDVLATLMRSRRTEAP